MIPKRYRLALFVGLLFLLLALWGQSFKPFETKDESGGPASALTSPKITIEAELRLDPEWVPRLYEPTDPLETSGGSAGFGMPWESAEAFLGDQGFVLNHPSGISHFMLWRDKAWRVYRFQAPIISARLNPQNNNQGLFTFRYGPKRFETRLMDFPNGNIIWAVASGPWSRFSWDGRSVLLGREEKKNRLLLASLPTHDDLPAATLAPYDEKEFRPQPLDVAIRPGDLSDEGQGLPGYKIVSVWSPQHRLWFPQQNQLWIADRSYWVLWRLRRGQWRRAQGGEGTLIPILPQAFGLIRGTDRSLTQLRDTDRPIEFSPVPEGRGLWPTSMGWFSSSAGGMRPDGMLWGAPMDFKVGEWNSELEKIFRNAWQEDIQLRPSLKTLLPQGPQVRIFYQHQQAWVWVGSRIFLVRLGSSSSDKKLQRFLSTWS